MAAGPATPKGHPGTAPARGTRDRIGRKKTRFASAKRRKTVSIMETSVNRSGGKPERNS